MLLLNNFQPTTNKKEYEKHVMPSHDGKLAYPTLVYLKKIEHITGMKEIGKLDIVIRSF